MSILFIIFSLLILCKNRLLFFYTGFGIRYFDFNRYIDPLILTILLVFWYSITDLRFITITVNALCTDCFRTHCINYNWWFWNVCEKKCLVSFCDLRQVNSYFSAPKMYFSINHCGYYEGLLKCDEVAIIISTFTFIIWRLHCFRKQSRWLLTFKLDVQRITITVYFDILWLNFMKHGSEDNQLSLFSVCLLLAMHFGGSTSCRKCFLFLPTNDSQPLSYFPLMKTDDVFVLLLFNCLFCGSFRLQFPLEKSLQCTYLHFTNLF